MNFAKDGRWALCALLGIALISASCSAGSPTAGRPTTSSSTPLAVSPQVETASHGATMAYRRYMAEAGFQLSASLSTLAADEATDPTRVPADLAAAQRLYDEIRVQLMGSSTGSMGGASSQLDQLGSVTLNGASTSGSAAVEAALQVEAPEIELILSRIVLSPQDIALSAKQAAEWIAIQDPLIVAGGASTLSSEDIALTAQACSAWVQILEPVGSLVAPAAMERSLGAVSELSSITQSPSGATPREVVDAADAAVASLSTLAGDLYGYGVGAQYQ